MQILEGEHRRLRPRARHNPGRHRRQLPAAQFLGRQLRPAVLAAAECRPAARARAHIRPRRGRSAPECSRGRRDALRRSRRRRRSAVCPIRRAGAEACSAGAARRSIRPRCAASRQFCAKFLDQARLADAGLADDLHELALAFERARPAAHQQRKLVLAADERRQGARPAAPAAAARPHDAIERDWLGTPLRSCAPLSSTTKSPAVCRCTPRCDEHRPRFGSACTRAATFGASPNISPAASTTTGPLSRPMRALSSGAPARHFWR